MAPGDSFVVVSCADDALGAMPSSFTLEAADGFAGTVSATGGQLWFTPALKADPPVADLMHLDRTDDGDLAHTKLYFGTELKHRYDRASVTVYANVAEAT